MGSLIGLIYLLSFIYGIGIIFLLKTCGLDADVVVNKRWLEQAGIVNSTGRISPIVSRLITINPESVAKIVEATSFIKYNADLKSRIHFILQSITHQPLCLVCETPLKMTTSGPRANTIGKYCGAKCAVKDPTVVKQRAESNLAKYGTTSAGQTVQAIQKRKATNIQRYGVDNPTKNLTVRAKQVSTNIERYGSTNYMSTLAGQTRVKATNFERYGYENVLSNGSPIRDKVNLTMIKRYGVDNPFKLQEFQDKADASMLVKYGSVVPLQNSIIYSKFAKTMLDKYGLQHFHGSQILPASLSKLQDLQWMCDQYTHEQKTTGKIADELNVSKSLVNNWLHKHKIEIESRNTSQFERDVGAFISNTYTGTVLLNDRTQLGKMELDIYLPDINTAIECNGVFWHSELNGKPSNYHVNKTTMCEAVGLRLIHILDVEWYTNQHIVLSRIRNLFGNSNAIFARKCRVAQVPSMEAANFFRKNHIQGPAVATISYGLYNNATLVACMSFIKSRFNKQVQWELLRFANLSNNTVVGGASKLFARFVHDYSPTSIISYSDKRWNTGGLYIALGFKYTHTSSPNYQYFNPSTSSKLYSRITFQKHKLQKVLETFNPNHTEWQNMQANGYDRIWDCGNMVFVWNSTT